MDHGYHGYFVFRAIIKNNDSVPHKVSLTCPNIAEKKYELRPGETINASLPLPITNSNFGDFIQISVDNKKLDSVRCPMYQNEKTHISSRSYGSSGHGYDEEILDYTTFLACRSLRSQLAEADVIFAEADCKQWPQDRLDYSSLDAILLTPAELSAAPSGVQTALRQFVLAGGILWLFDCENQKEELDKIEWIVQLKKETSPIMMDYQQLNCSDYPVAFGRVVLSNFTPDKFRSTYLPNNSSKHIITDIYQCFDFQSASKITWFEKQDINNWHRYFPIANDLNIPIFGICIVIFLFVMLAGPINLFFLTKYNKRIWLLATVPALSLLFSGAILLYVVLSDGFNTDSRIAVGSYLDQRNGMYSAMMQYGVYARTSPRDIVFDSNEELNIIDDNNDDNRLNIDWTTGKQVIHSNFVSVRKPSYYKIRKAGTTRLKLDFDFNAENPYVVNGLGKDVDQLFVRSADGALWRAENIKAGQKAQLTSVNQFFDEANRKQPLAYPACIASSTWKFSKASVNGISKDLPPQSYIATFNSSGPFSNNGITYAKEKEPFAFLLGRF